MRNLQNGGSDVEMAANDGEREGIVATQIRDGNLEGSLLLGVIPSAQSERLDLFQITRPCGIKPSTNGEL